ncbi:MAG: hypothetical protein JXR95_07890 [Deltaproteobacteria bacterium]|nr:hypothetical protein [Deltaproteobacteria bacterium]
MKNIIYFLLLLLFSACSSDENTQEKTYNVKILYSGLQIPGFSRISLSDGQLRGNVYFQTEEHDIFKVTPDNEMELSHQKCISGELSNNLLNCSDGFYHLDSDTLLTNKLYSEYQTAVMGRNGRLIYFYDKITGLLSVGDTKLSYSATDDYPFVLWNSDGNKAVIVAGNGKKILFEEYFDGELKHVFPTDNAIYFIYSNEKGSFLKTSGLDSSEYDDFQLIDKSHEIISFAMNQEGQGVFLIDDSMDVLFLDQTHNFSVFLSLDIIPDKVFFRKSSLKFALVDSVLEEVFEYSPQSK